MKRVGSQCLMILGFFTVAAVMGSAQTIGLRVDVPFTFNVAEKVLPAGHYLILAPQGQTLRILGPSGTSALAMTNRINGRRPQAPGAVVFNCYGRRCFLSQFWTERTDVGQEVIQSRIERELATEKQQLAVITLRASHSH